MPARSLHFSIMTGLAMVVMLAAIQPVAQRSTVLAPRWPGVQGDGVTLLPNGWRIAPAGKSL